MIIHATSNYNSKVVIEVGLKPYYDQNDNIKFVAITGCAFFLIGGKCSVYH